MKKIIQIVISGAILMAIPPWPLMAAPFLAGSASLSGTTVFLDGRSNPIGNGPDFALTLLPLAANTDDPSTLFQPFRFELGEESVSGNHQIQENHYISVPITVGSDQQDIEVRVLLYTFRPATDLFHLRFFVEPTTFDLGSGNSFQTPFRDLQFPVVHTGGSLIQGVLPWQGFLVVSEPSTLAIFALGLAGLGFMRRRRTGGAL